MTALGVTDSMKSGAGAPVAGVTAVAWFGGPEVPLESNGFGIPRSIATGAIPTLRR